ncbi:MAG: hypothetical protein ABGW77_07120, partial [Campylobacterales bacterium]
ILEWKQNERLKNILRLLHLDSLVKVIPLNIRFKFYPTKEQERFLRGESGNIWNYYEYKKLLPR